MKGKSCINGKPAKEPAQRKGLGQEELEWDERLAMLQAAHERGDEWAWILAVDLCAWEQVPMPPWVAAEWLHRSHRAITCQVNSWDTLLPPVKARGKKRPSVEQDLMYGAAVVGAVVWAKGPRQEVNERLRDKLNMPIGPVDDALFEELCARYEWPFGPDKAKKLYYQMRRIKNWSRYSEAGRYSILPSRKALRKQVTSTKRRKP